MDEFKVEEKEKILEKENVEEINKVVVFAFNLFEVCAQAFSLVVLIFYFVFKTIAVDGDSMQNTLNNKDRLFVVNSFLKRPKEKDIVILNTYDVFNFLIVKRIVATEGQKVELKQEGENFYVYVNDSKLDENYIKEPIDKESVGVLKYPLVVPKGYVYVLGDNRNNSTDSRIMGLVNVEKIMGVCWFRFLPVSKFKTF